MSGKGKNTSSGRSLLKSSQGGVEKDLIKPTEKQDCTAACSSAAYSSAAVTAIPPSNPRNTDKVINNLVTDGKLDFEKVLLSLDLAQEDTIKKLNNMARLSESRDKVDPEVYSEYLDQFIEALNSAASACLNQVEILKILKYIVDQADLQGQAKRAHGTK